MDILELTTILLSLASVFSIINLRLLKLPQTIGLMILALILSVLVTIIGIVFPNIFELGKKSIRLLFIFSNVI